MSEWQLFEAGAVPDFTTPGFFAAHRWIDPSLQHGHAERMGGAGWIGPEASVLAYAAKGLKPGRHREKRRPASRSA